MGKVLDKIKNDNLFIKIIYFLIGIFIASFIYNAVFVPNNIVIGGVSGLAIIFKKLLGIDTSIFIDVSNLLLIIISFIFLGKKDTIAQLLGCIAYPLMITFTSPIASAFTINMESKLLLYIISAIVYGFSTGIIYRAGFSTGGTDIIVQIMSNKMKKPITKLSTILHNVIVILGGIVFSPVQIMYAIFIIVLSNQVTNKILFGISNNKMVYVISKKNNDIEDYIMSTIHTGATEIKIKSGLFQKKKQMIFCVVHNSQYKEFKHNILKMDPNAFILANNCYEVKGGIKHNILPF